MAVDGLKREALIDKCTGVFAQEADPRHYLSERLVPPLVLPHSRRNEIRSNDVSGAGYSVALGSPAVGWSVATKTIEGTEMLLLQGHPEYGPDTLVREYQRDVRRYVSHEREESPPLPRDCVDGVDADALATLHARVISGADAAGALEAFDFDAVMRRAPWPWRPMAITIYENWLAGQATGSR